MSNVRAYLAAAAALVTCPCHLVVLMPLLLALTAGTAVGAFLAQHQAWLYALSAGLFILSLALAVVWWSAEDTESTECCAVEPELGQTGERATPVSVQERGA